MIMPQASLVSLVVKASPEILNDVGRDTVSAAHEWELVISPDFIAGCTSVVVSVTSTVTDSMPASDEE
jgi:hypothetical protein